MRILALLGSLILYIIFLFGLFLIFINSFKSLYGRITLRKRLSEKRGNSSSLKLKEKADEYVYLALGKEKKGRILLFVTYALFIFVFVFSMLYYSLLFSLIIALLVASVPSLSLVSKIQNNRNRGSREGQNFVNELYRQYRIQNKNIYSALEKTSTNSSDFPVCGKQAYMLLLKLRASGNPAASKKACSDFAESIGSLWSKTVSCCVAAAVDGMDISEALLDIMHQLKRSKTEAEEKKRLNGEAGRMTMFLVPVMYIGTVYVSINYLGLSFSEYLRNQFLNPSGFLLFILSLLLFVINSLVLAFINNGKIDI